MRLFEETAITDSKCSWLIYLVGFLNDWMQYLETNHNCSDVLLTVRLSIISVINQLNAQNLVL